MKKQTFQIALTPKELNEMAGRYHFDGEALPQIEALYRTVLPLLRTEAVYRLLQNGKLASLHMPFTDVCACAVTLGAGIDRLQELYSEVGAVWENYILECIGNTLLEKAYEKLSALIWQETGLYLNEYRFPGSEMPIETVKEILQELSEGKASSIVYNEVYTLQPKKSVVFLGILGERKRECSVCNGCGRMECECRKRSVHKKDEEAFRKSENYSYGYQRIFGVVEKGEEK